LAIFGHFWLARVSPRAFAVLPSEKGRAAAAY